MYSHVHTCVMRSPFPADCLMSTCSCICFISNTGLKQEANFGPVALPLGSGRRPSWPCFKLFRASTLGAWLKLPVSASPGRMLTCSCRTTNSTSSLGRTATASPRMLTCRPRGAWRGHCSCTGLCCRSTPPSHTLDTTFRYLVGWGRFRSRADSGLMGRDRIAWLQPLQSLCYLLPMLPHGCFCPLISESIRMERWAVLVCFGELKHPWLDHIAHSNNNWFCFVCVVCYGVTEGDSPNSRSCWELWRTEWLKWTGPWFPEWL
jgi:hypothetical protein